MCPNYIVMRLAGFLMSFGQPGRMDVRPTFGFPSKSSVVGLIMSAMGKPRDDVDTIREVAGLSMTVFRLKAGDILTDYQTAGGGGRPLLTVNGVTKKVKGSSSKAGKTGVFRKDYLMDAEFIIVLEGEPGLIDRCREALLHPTFILFLGRKACLPSKPIFEEVFEDGDEVVEFIRTEARSSGLDCVDYVEDVNSVREANDSLLDMPVEFGKATGGYRRRFVKYDVMQVEG